ncbi:hypothetical protein ACFLU5_17400 [Bacteroidota bacterium]
MIRKAFASLLALFTISNLYAEEHIASFDFIGDTKFLVVTKERGEKLVSAYDPYIEKLSKFDLEGRINTLDNPTSRDYLDFSRRQVRIWRNEEIRKLEKIINTIKSKFLAQRISLELPDTIELIKSTCMEEGGAIGYTRMNFIVLAENFIYEDVLLHELFHIYSRYNPNKRKQLYAILGFHQCNVIEYPQLIRDRKMTNPDAPDNDFFIRVLFQEDSLDVLLAIYATTNYDGNGFFSYLNKRLIVLTGEGYNKQPVIKEGKPVLLRFNNVSGLYEQIGRNTEFNIHPEEICADHFIHLLSRKRSGRDQDLIDKMGAVLRE